MHHQIGISKPEKIAKLQKAIEQLKDMGYRVIETESVRKSVQGASTSPEKRAEEFMELLENDEVKSIIFAAGGDFLPEMLDYLDFEKIKTLKPKWLQGYSDITNIGLLFNTILDIPTIYCQTIKDYAMKPLHKSLTDSLELQAGNEILQESFNLYEKPWNPFEADLSLGLNSSQEDVTNEETLCRPYELTEKVEWKNIVGGEKIVMKGRTLGGCLDCVQNLIGTKYDNINNYIEKHKQDGIIWFLECFEKSTPNVFCILWQMKSAGYFKNCKGIIFGRPLFARQDYEISFNQAVKRALEDLNIPIICDADIGHVSPQMAIVNGAILKITSENGKGKVETFLI